MSNPLQVAVGYIRVSTPEQAKTGVGLETQQQKIEEFCKEKNFQLFHIFKDEGISATDMSRSGLDELLKFIKPGLNIILYELSRGARTQDDSDEFKKMIRDRGGILHTLDNPLGYDNPEGKLFGHIIAYKAEKERLDLIKRIVDGMSKLSSENSLRGKPPFGFKFAPKYPPIIDEEQQQVISLICRLYDEGMLPSHIADKLNKEGYNVFLKNSGKNVFYTTSIINILIDWGKIEDKSGKRKPIIDRLSAINPKYKIEIDISKLNLSLPKTLENE